MPRHRGIHDLAKVAEAQGWTVARTKSDHYRWVSPDGQVLFSPSTPSDRRSLLNVRAKLKRAGLKETE